MAISLQKLCLVFISVFVSFFRSPCLSLPHRLMSNRCQSHESESLLRFKAALNDFTDFYFSSWVNGTDCCTEWRGISCENHTNHIVSVDTNYIVSGHHLGFSDAYPFQGVISESLCQLPFLTSLTISGVVTAGTTIPPCLVNLSYIESLDLSSNSFSGMIPPFLCLLTRLTVLDLSDNNFNGSIPSCLGNLSYIHSLDLSTNSFSGMIPASLCFLTRLRFLDLSVNSFNGRIPSCLANLATLDLSYNQLSGIIPDSLGNLSSLRLLDISNNQLSGTIPPSFAQLSSLTDLIGNGNRFNETISSSSLPPSLTNLILSLNHYQSISETFFHNLSGLTCLYLSDCVLNISTTWIPPFQLSNLTLVSCMIDGEFPPWISTQFRLYRLEISNASLVGVFPSWLCETSPHLEFLNLSGNHLEGSLSSNTLIRIPLLELDLSRNRLSGYIPSMQPYILKLLLNDNLFSGNIPSSLGKLTNLLMLNLANNNITGVIPTSLSNFSSLFVLNLANNSLEGSLPHEFGKLSDLYSLVVHSNNLHGSFPISIINCSELQVLDIGNNLFGGEIPRLIGNLSKLRVLVMKENNFTGSIPLEVGQLMNLQILLLSSNHISGSIPHTIVSLQAMTIESQDGFVLSLSGLSYQDGLEMTVKGTLQIYKYILSTLTSIDLSNNELEGEVTSDFGNLKGLRLLNLSMNNLNGTIPNSLGEMSQLESLDLSRNHFSGKIPIELESLNFLGSLNLSNNNLSGSIPQGRHITGTFGESSYSSNPYLWGCPLPKNCSWPQFAPPPPQVSMNKEEKGSKYSWYKIAVGLSYGVAFGGILLLILTRINWRSTYFNKVDKILKLFFPWMKNLTL